MSSVDVIVPCYGYGHFLRECVESVLSQSLQTVRVLIIDDASPDNTAEVATALASRDSRVAIVRHAANKGHIATYNEGLEWASAEYVLLLSADDYLLPGALERAARLMDAHPEVGFTCGHAIELYEDQSNPFALLNQTSGDNGWTIVTFDEFVALAKARNIVQTPTVVVRTRLQKQVGGYRRELPHSGDMEMWLRLAARSAVGMTREYQAVYRRHNANMSLHYTRRRDLEQRKAALDIFFAVCGATLRDGEAYRRRLYWFLGCDAMRCASAAFNEGDREACNELRAFARGLCAYVCFSAPSIALTGKRVLGVRASRHLQTALSRLQPRSRV